MESAQALTVPDVRQGRSGRSRSPAAALLRRVRLGSSRSLSQRRAQPDASSPEASDRLPSPSAGFSKNKASKRPERTANCSSSDEERPTGGSPERRSGPAVLRSMRRQLRNRLLRSRHKKAAGGGPAEQAVAQWLDQSDNGAAPPAPPPAAAAGATLASPKPPSRLEDELDADAEFEEDEMSSVMAPLTPRRINLHEPTLPGRQQRDPGTVWEVVVHLISGSQLVIRDSTGTSDPYVKFKYNGKMLERSKIVRKTLNPIWDEYFCFYVDGLQKPLEMRVYDYDKLYDDYMGRALVDLSTMEIDKSSELTLELEDETGKSKEKFMGTVRLSCRITLSTMDSETASTVSTAKVAFSSYAAKAKVRSGLNVAMPTSKKAALMLRGLRTAMDVSRRFKGTNWIATVTITLIEGYDLLAMDDNGLSDPFVKFKLGNEKYRSKILRSTLNPRWLEQFDLRLGSDDVPRADILEMTVWDHDDIGRNDFMGRASISLANLEREQTHLIEQPLQDGAGMLRLLITISGSFEPDSVTDLRNYTVSEVDRQLLVSKYNLMHSFTKMNEVGWLQVKVLKAEGLSAVAWSGKIDAFVVVNLVNSRLQTHTVYRSGEPEWNKVFVFHVHDIHSILEITVFDEEREKSEILGRVGIPLLKIRNGEKRWYALKDRKLLRRGKGAILLEMDFIYNYMKAVWRTVNPKETKYTRPDPKFRLAAFRSHIDRISRIIDGCILFGQFVESCFAWESPPRSLAAFASYVVAVWTFEPYMLPLTLVIIFVKEYFHGWFLSFLYRRSRQEDGRRLDDPSNASPTAKEAAYPTTFNNNSNRRWNSLDDGFFSVKFSKKPPIASNRRSLVPCATCCSAPKASSSSEVRPHPVPGEIRSSSFQEYIYPTSTDDDDKSDKEDKRTTIKERIQTVQDTMLKVQEYMGSVAAFFERVRNTFTWTVPWLSLLAVFALVVVTVILYCIPLRWLALAWGVNKFTKKLLRPHAIDNNEVLDFLSRVPSDIQMIQYKELKPDVALSSDKRR